MNLNEYYLNQITHRLSVPGDAIFDAPMQQLEPRSYPNLKKKEDSTGAKLHLRSLLELLEDEVKAHCTGEDTGEGEGIQIVDRGRK